MSVCVYSVLLQDSRLANLPFKEFYRLRIRLRHERAAKAQKRAVEP
jgi:hypothetical protein